MFDFIAGMFVKDCRNTKSGVVRESYGRLAGKIGIICNIVLFISKLVLGVVFHSISVIADAVNNISDALSSLVTIISFRISNKPADKDHPYGHRRAEYVAALLVAFGIIIVGYELFKTSLEKFFHPQHTKFGTMTVFVLSASIMIKLFMNRMYMYYANVIDSAVLRASAQDSLNDVLSTGTVLVCAVVGRFTGLELDAYAAMAVSVFIIWSGIKLVRETLDPLLGSAPDKNLVSKLEKEILSYNKIIGIHDLMLHSYGPDNTYASVHAEISADVDVVASHEILDNIERSIKQQFGINMIIHLDPVITDDEYTNDAKQKVAQVLCEISPEISLHDFRTVKSPDNRKFVFDVEIPYNFKLSDKALDELIRYKLNQSFDGETEADISYDKR